MNARIDLKELAARESEQVEWKENVADEEDVVATIVAFANDLSNLGGGYVVCGAQESRACRSHARLLRRYLRSTRSAKLADVTAEVPTLASALTDV